MPKGTNKQHYRKKNPFLNFDWLRLAISNVKNAFHSVKSSLARTGIQAVREGLYNLANTMNFGVETIEDLLHGDILNALGLDNIVNRATSNGKTLIKALTQLLTGVEQDWNNIQQIGFGKLLTKFFTLDEDSKNDDENQDQNSDQDGSETQNSTGFRPKADVSAPKNKEVIMGKTNFKKGTNHPTWYTKYDVSNLINLNFGKRNSVRNNVLTSIQYDSTYVDSYYTPNANAGCDTSAACRVLTEMVIPKDSNGSFMQACNILYAKIRSANSGAVNYTVADLAAYLLNKRSILASLAHVRRLVQTAHMINPYDADLPNLLSAVAGQARFVSPNYYGLTFKTIASNLANMVNTYNLWADKVENLIPGSCALFDRTEWLYSNIFKDDSVTKANYYIVTTKAVPYFTNTSGVVAIGSQFSLQPSNSTSFDANLSVLMGNIDSLITTVCNTTVNAIIAGDLLKAFGDGMLRKVDRITVDSKLTPIFDESVLTQIQNATVTGTNPGTITSSVDFVNGTITNSFTDGTTYGSVNRSVFANSKGRIVNTYKDSINAGEVLSYTRLQSMFAVATNTVTFSTVGTEFVSDVAYYYGYDATHDVYSYFTLQDINYGLNSSSIGQFQGNQLACIVNCWTLLDWSPMLFIPCCDNQALSHKAALSIEFDMANYAEITTNDLDVMHQYATLSLLAFDTHIKRQSEFNFSK